MYKIDIYLNGKHFKTGVFKESMDAELYYLQQRHIPNQVVNFSFEAAK